VASCPHWLGTLQGRGSGARRATWTQQHAQCFACSLDASLAYEPSDAYANGFCCTTPTFGLELCKAEFCGSPRYLESKQHAHRFAALLDASFAHEPGAASQRGSPWLRGPRCPGSLQGRVQGLAVLLGTQTTRSPFRVPYRANPLRTVQRHTRFADVNPVACAVRFRRFLACVAKAGCCAGV
jgi:hypothetical protein